MYFTPGVHTGPNWGVWILCVSSWNVGIFRGCGCLPSTLPLFALCSFHIGKSGASRKTKVIARDASFRVTRSFHVINPLCDLMRQDMENYPVVKFVSGCDWKTPTRENCVTFFFTIILENFLLLSSISCEWMINCHLSVDRSIYEFCVQLIYLLNRTFLVVPSECCVSFHSALSRCHFCPFWACHLGRKCTKWLISMYPLCSAAFRTAMSGCEF